jgi:arabinogalactan endo-1,4-beta-galactosidase
LGLKFLLDFHYSDTWADPGRQTKPAAWSGLPYEVLKDSVYQYTRRVISALKNQQTLPDMVQIGNEIICGMLWNDGRVCDPYNTPQQWNRLAELIREGIRGVNESLDAGDTVKTMIHIDRGGDNGGSRWFFDHLLAQNVDFDIIGLSYYPWWHGALSNLQANTFDLAQRYGKPIILAEIAYPWTLAWNDNTNNIVGNSGQLLPGYPASVEGQTAYLRDVLNLVGNIPNEKGWGVFYWAPDWISAPQLGSPWENLALFDFDGELLNSISAFDSTLTDISPPGEISYTFHLYQNYPNPFNPATNIPYELTESSQVLLRIYTVTGQEVRTLVNTFQIAGKYMVSWNGKGEDGRKLSSGLYIYSLQSGHHRQSKKMLLLY